MVAVAVAVVAVVAVAVAGDFSRSGAASSGSFGAEVVRPARASYSRSGAASSGSLQGALVAGSQHARQVASRQVRRVGRRRRRVASPRLNQCRRRVPAIRPPASPRPADHFDPESGRPASPRLPATGNPPVIPSKIANREDWQDYGTNAREDRQDYGSNAREDWQEYGEDYHGGYGGRYYGGFCYPTGGVAAGMVIGATLTAAAFSAQQVVV